MKEKSPHFREKHWKIDSILALHQRLCWLGCALMAIAGALIILNVFPPNASVYATIVLALALMFLYQWLAQAPARAMIQCMERAEDSASAAQMLKWLLNMEKSLPGMKKKEMAYDLVLFKGILMLRAGCREDALALFKNFTQIWDDRQKEQLQNIIARIEIDPAYDGWNRKENT